MSVRDDIRKQLEASLQPKLAKANPLRTIGFSLEILRLGLSEDELYDYAYATARNLFMRVHPDRARTNEIKEQQDRVSEAFDLLKDRSLFSKWLRDFSEELSSESQKLTTMRQSHERMRTSYDGDQTTIKSLNGQLATETSQRKAIAKRFRNYLLMRTQFLKGTRVFSAEQDLVIRVLNFRFYFDDDTEAKKKLAKRGEALFPIAQVSDRCIEKIPNAKRSNELVLAFASFRQFLASRGTLPFVGIKVQELKTVSGHYADMDRGQMTILGAIAPQDTISLGFNLEYPGSVIKVDSITPVLTNEIYPGALLVTDALKTKSLGGVEADAQLRNLHLKLSKMSAVVCLSDVVIDVHSSDPT